MNGLSRTLVFLAGVLMMTTHAAKAAPPETVAKRSPLLAAMQAELDRSIKTFGMQTPPAYFIGYTITDSQHANVSGSNGALLSSSEDHNRWLEVSVRTGSYQLDDSHKVCDKEMPNGGPGSPVPVDDDPVVLRRAMWLETDKQYRAAEQAYIKVKTGKEVKVETAEGQAPDFSQEKTHVFIGPQVSMDVDRKPWEAKVRAYTAAFRDSKAVINSIVTFTAKPITTFR